MVKSDDPMISTNDSPKFCCIKYLKNLTTNHMVKPSDLKNILQCPGIQNKNQSKT